MAFDVLQSELTAPTTEQLVAAYQSVEGLAASDAIHVARYQFGILAENMPEARATALVSSLQAQGVKAAAVDHANLPALPPPKTTRQLDCLPEALTTYDGLGRGHPLGWDRVLLVAVGEVGYFQEKIDKRYVRVPNGMARLGGIGGMSGTHLEVDRTRQEVESSSLVLEVLLDAEPFRCRTSSDTLLYNYLGPRRQPKRTANFNTVVADLLRLAPRALMNRGAAMLTQPGGRTLSYHNRATFEKEMVWLLWWSSNSKS